MSETYKDISLEKMLKTKFKELISLGGIYSFGSVMEKALGFLFIPIYTTFLTTKDYGIIALVSITVNLVGPFISVPVNNGFVRHYYAPGYEHKRKEIFFNGILYVLIQSVIVGIVFYFVSSYLAELILGDRSLNHIVRIYAIILLLTPLKPILNTLIQIQKKAKLYVSLNLSRLLLSAGVIIYLLVVERMGVMALVYGALFIVSYDIIVLIPFLLKNIEFRINFFILKPLLSYGYPLILSSISMYLIQIGDRYVLRIFDTMSTVGLYSFGYSIGTLIIIFLVKPMKLIMNPLIYEMEHDESKLKKFVAISCNYFYIVALFFFLVLSVFAKDIIQLLARKEEFWGAWIIVPIIAFSYVLSGLRDLFGKGMIMAKKSFHSGGTYAVAAAINLGLNFLIIPYFGMLGAAFATMISFIVLTIISAHYSYKFYGLTFDFGKLVKITFIGLALYLLSFLGNFQPIYIGLLYKMCLLVSFPILLYVSGVFTETEKEYLSDLIKRMKSDGPIRVTKGLISSLRKG